ncbi:MAG TPA: YkgJ family cysteine cluster protein [Bdellovibrionales bacterium]|nr:YkgJ family cysteine cluster protein [Bdellovibrionales bacterium]
MKKKFWAEGLRFECQGAGGCCISRGGYGAVYLTIDDRRRLAAELELGTALFTRRYCERSSGVWKLKEPGPECVFLAGSKCSVYTARPTQCRTWPFWPEVLNARAWTGEVAALCPGIGKGRLWTAAEIETQLNDQKRSEELYGS